MKFSDICIITENVTGLAKFYEAVFHTSAEGDSIHCVINAGGLSIAIYDKAAAQTDMGFDFAGAGTGLAFIGFDVDDADAEYERIKQLGIRIEAEPRLWPWGAKSFHFKDIDGNYITFRSFPGAGG